MDTPYLKRPEQDIVSSVGVEPYVPGGTLMEFLHYLEEAGKPCGMSEDGTQVWFPDVPGELIRLPLECVEPVEPELLRRLLHKRGVWVLSFLLEASENHPANCFDYVCRDPDYAIESLPAESARRNTRQGLRSLAVRVCTWDELAEKGFRAQADTAARHGYSIPSREEWDRNAQQHQELPFFEIWGAWNGDDLAGWLQVVKIDDWAMINVVRSCTRLLDLRPNNAMLYMVTRQMLVEENRSYVSYGLSSSQVDAKQSSMHRFKTSMGYEALPRHRRFVAHPLLHALVGPRPASWMWEKVAAIMPKSAILRKAAGMSRLISGREKIPLAWTKDKS